ncbi:MAG TPA: heavy-metal-associated domain-containing protein [Gaiellales bacterium]|nr:heavy-metal-associated domain-containing protein [Gaiellales bacterium]
MTVAGPQATTIGVQGMHCGGCERSLVAALTALPGVEAATADHVAEEVVVMHDPGLAGDGALRGAIAAAGFTPR